MSGEIKRMESNGCLSRVVIHNGVVYLTGLATDVPENCRTMTEHAENVFRRIDHYLEMAGTDKTRILSATLYFADYSKKPEFDEAWKKWIPLGCEPSRTAMTCVGYSDKWPVEVTIIAALH
ncbi:MAG: RidA family protein [Lachnospiraceae bacterium]|nr:RidA family protein [Lachnospiraceae bacterium]